MTNVDKMMDGNDPEIVFRKAIKKGTWRERLKQVTLINFVNSGLSNEEKYRKTLMHVALTDSCHLVKSEAVRTCNLLGITDKNGKKIKLTPHESLDKVSKIPLQSRKEHVLIAAIEAGVPVSTRSVRGFTKEEKRKLCNELKELQPKLYDRLDGYYMTDKSDIDKEQNLKLQSVLCGYLSSISSKRIYKFYRQNPEKLINEPKEYQEMVLKKIKLSKEK